MLTVCPELGLGLGLGLGRLSLIKATKLFLLNILVHLKSASNLSVTSFNTNMTHIQFSYFLCVCECVCVFGQNVVSD